jgi:hypothetical protein
MPRWRAVSTCVVANQQNPAKKNQREDSDHAVHRLALDTLWPPPFPRLGVTAVIRAITLPPAKELVLPCCPQGNP